MRTLRDIAEAVLDYTDVTGDSDLLTNATVRQKKSLCSIITGALQELHVKKPEAFRQRVGFTLRAPETGTAGVVAGSTNLNVSAFARDLRGLTFRDGTTYNQVAPAATSPGSAAVLPWRGATGNQAITVYGDAILIGSSAHTVLGDVHLEGYGPLRAAPDRATYTTYRDWLNRGGYGTLPPSMSSPRWPGLPEAWWTESAYLVGSRSQLYLRFAPLPDREFSVSFDLGYVPRELVSADLANDDLVVPIPGDFYDAILIPYVLQRATGSPWFRNGEAKVEIARQFKVAQDMLIDWGPQVQSDCQVIVAIH